MKNYLVFVVIMLMAIALTFSAYALSNNKFKLAEQRTIRLVQNVCEHEYDLVGLDYNNIQHGEVKCTKCGKKYDRGYARLINAISDANIAHAKDLLEKHGYNVTSSDEIVDDNGVEWFLGYFGTTLEPLK